MNESAARPAEEALRPRTRFDEWRVLVVALFMTLIGYGVMVGIPVISAAWVDLLGFTEEQAGRVGGADLGGLALGSVLASLVMGRWNRRHIALAGLVIAIVANGLCTVYVTYETVLWLRVLAGIGSGIYVAVAVATLGGGTKPARAFNFMLFAFAFSQAGEMLLLPRLSMNGVYWFFIITFLVSAPFIRWLPAGPAEIELERKAKRAADPALGKVPRYLPWLCLTAIFFTYINIGTYWTYIKIASVGSGFEEGWVDNWLAIVSFGSIVGCAFATVISNRWGLGKPLLVTLAIMAVIVGILGIEMSMVNLLISLCLFNFLWIFIDVYQMGTVAVIDRTGTFASLMPGVQGLGQIVGPNIAASMLAANRGYSSIFILCSAAAMVGMAIYAIMYLRLKRQVPELAKQS